MTDKCIVIEFYSINDVKKAEYIAEHIDNKIFCAIPHSGEYCCLYVGVSSITPKTKEIMERYEYDECRVATLI